jgi:hypothetical protein
MRFRAASMAALLPPGGPAAHSPPPKANPGQPPARTRRDFPERDHPPDDQGFVFVLASNAAVLSGL